MSNSISNTKANGCSDTCSTLVTEPAASAAATKQTLLFIENLDCPSEEKLISTSLQQIPGIAAFEFDLSRRTLRVTHALDSTAPMMAALSAIGMHSRELESEVSGSRTTLLIPNMDCPTEERLIRHRLQGMAGIEEMQFDLKQRTLTLTHAPEALEAAKHALDGIGFGAKLNNELVTVGETCQSVPIASASSGCSSQKPTASCGCESTVPLLTPRESVSAAKQTVFRIENMDCPTEEALIRNSLKKMQGVVALDFNLVQRTLKVSHELSSTAPLVTALAAVGMKAQEVPAKGSALRTTLLISKMDCPTEETLIRKKLQGMPGIDDLQFNLMQRTLTLTHAPYALDAAKAALKQIGLEPETKELLAVGEDGAQSKPVSTTSWLPMAVSGVTAVTAEVIHWASGGNNWMVIALALAAILTGGLDTYKKGWIAVRNGNLNMNALMSIAVTGAMAIGQWPEAAMVMFLFALAEVIEQKSLDRARNAIRGLMDMAPETATVQQTDGSWVEMEAKAISLGALIRVRPGQRIALDGKLVSGQSTIDQAPITGESVPVEKSIGDPVFAGTINGAGSFEFEVTARSDSTTLARIIHAVEEAQGSRAPTQRFVDQFAKIYTPAVFVCAVLVAVVPPLAFGQPWYDWIYKALVLLVVACPCALVISTPVTIVSGLAAAARKGILIKGGVYLEQGRKLTWLALDKTGTLTVGKPSVTEYLPLGADPVAVLAIATSLAGRSDHPVSHAISVYGDAASAAHSDVDNFRALLGRGVEGTIGGQPYWLGNQRLAGERGQVTPELEGKLETLERQGRTAVMLGSSDQVLAIFGVADTLRQTSKQAIAELHELGVKTMMLTGDNVHTARAIASEVGIDDARGNQLPEEKLRAIEQLSADGATIGMVGDGINDAPALAKANIGFAMGAAGTDTAIETADVALMDDDLRKVPAFVRLSRSTSAILTQNIVLALGIKVVFLVLTFTGQATMWMAVFADMGASLLVVFNGLRLLRK